MDTIIEASIKLLVTMFLIIPTTVDTDLSYRYPLLEAQTEETEELIYGLVPHEEEEIEEEVKEEPKTREVLFTNFYVGDGTGSGTSVGLSVSDFSTNHKGWYTYNGKVVIATATNLCLNITTGPCAQYTYLPEGYESHDLWDELIIEFEGEQYEAIVLSSCGACFWEEERQRIDIFVTTEGRFGTKVGGVTHKD